MVVVAVVVRLFFFLVLWRSSTHKMTGLKDTREPSQVNCFYQSYGKSYISLIKHWGKLLLAKCECWNTYWQCAMDKIINSKSEVGIKCCVSCTNVSSHMYRVQWGCIAVSSTHWVALVFTSHMTRIAQILRNSMWKRSCQLYFWICS